MHRLLDLLLEIEEKKELLIISLVIAITSAFAWMAYNSEIQAFPEFTNVQVQVITQFPGKAAEEVERQITIPVEVSTNGLPDLLGQRSISIFGLSVVTLTFADNVKSRQARLDVTQRLNDVDLPDGVKPTLNPDSTPVGEIFRYSLEGYLPSAEMRMIQDWTLEREFRSIPGVADVVTFGGPSRTVDVLLDLGRIKRFGLGVEEVAQNLGKNHSNAGGAQLSRGEESFIVRSLGMFRNPEGLEEAVVATNESTPVRVRDLGSERQGEKPRNGQAARNDQDDVVEGILLLRQGANTLETCARIRDKVAYLNEKVLPKGAQIAPIYDRTTLIRASAGTVTHNVVFGIVLVCIVLLLGFGIQYWSFVLGVALIIPFALLTALVGVKSFGFTPNLISLGAVDFGIIIETAIFASEALIITMGRSKERSRKLISESLSEVLGPSLLCAGLLIIAFIPILTLEQVEGRIFRPLGITLVCALAGGQLGALLFVPYFSRFAPIGHHSKSKLDSFLEKIAHGLIKLGTRFSKIPRLSSISLVLFLLAIFSLFLGIGREFLPNLNEGSIYARASGPKTLSLDAMKEVAEQVRDDLQTIPEVTDVVTQIGRPDDGTDVNGFDNLEFFVKLVPPDKWKSENTIEGFMNLCRQKVAHIEGVDFSFSQPIKDNVDEAISGVKGELVLKVFGKEIDVLQELVFKARDIIRAVPGAVEVAVDELKGQPELQFKINKEKLSRYGIQVTSVQSVLESAMLGKKAGRLLDSENRFVDIRVKLDLPTRPTSNMLMSLPVLTPKGGTIPLGEVTDSLLVEGISRVYREQGERRAAVRASVRGRPVVELVEEANKALLEKLELPPGYRIQWAGSFENAKRAAKRLSIVVPLCLIAIMILLHAWFGSWKLVWLSLWQFPFALLGGLGFLKIFGLNLSISAAAGIIVLLGVTLLTGIMVLTVWLRVNDAWKAIEESLKGVLLSSGVAIVGLIPAALSHGIGAETGKPFAVSILGGLITSLFFTLFLFPAILSRAQSQPTPPTEAKDH